MFLLQGNQNVMEDSDNTNGSRSARDRAKRDLSKQLSTDTTSDSSNSDNEIGNNSTVFGTTTRRQWSDWCRGAQYDEEMTG